MVLVPDREEACAAARDREAVRTGIDDAGYGDALSNIGESPTGDNPDVDARRAVELIQPLPPSG